MSVSLQCVFHSIRFKVNKGWSTAVLLFFALYFPFGLMLFRKRHRQQSNMAKCGVNVYICRVLKSLVQVHGRISRV
ncbi:hypothetical protein F9959_07115 [Bacteroides stercoris]|uniref:Uncharacterized protein n=1 Tax=Bacteroides stercoris TaxID=46506 RepID=A0A414L2C4_BACSE|nr:hypothetical protein F9968_06670 [Bacteroides stercoris]KAB5263740.1 hypothetical protein F9966_05775 [Bacteroides stercoris]KAB5282351.1 hypothetical protein F9962_06505 [Bacteroides stercoris]KAB5285632.1 hypothetical protein F9957_06690 [Bacteroides stercoris]KAB5288357.1 hypothetical protein F9964_05050 [Bacteroides stercoris]